MNFSEAVSRKLVAERSTGLCERCGVQGHSLHHRLKRSQGGSWHPSNCVWVCGHGTAGCHGWIEHNPDLAHGEGFHVRPWESPENVPLVRWGSLVWLTSDGGWTEKNPLPM